MHRLLLLLSSVCTVAAFAQPAISPRPGESANDAQFRGEAAARYQAILARLSTTGKLDDDRAVLDRVRRIGAGLIVAAENARPVTAAWQWEVHVTSDPSVAAFCIAGGKILVGSALVRRLDLTDGELAMLLGHEIAHAIAGHRRESARAEMDGDPAQEIGRARIAVMQENEADEIGMTLAYRAGWPAASLVSFYEKLASQEPAGTFSSSHPSSASRIAAARALADRLGQAPR